MKDLTTDRTEYFTENMEGGPHVADNFFEEDSALYARGETALTGVIIGSAIKVPAALGPGLLESAHEECLYYELRNAGLRIEKQKPLPLIYEQVRLECGYRVDLLVENKVIVEIKSVEALNDVHLARF